MSSISASLSRSSKPNLVVVVGLFESPRARGLLFTRLILPLGSKSALPFEPDTFRSSNMSHPADTMEHRRISASMESSSPNTPRRVSFHELQRDLSRKAAEKRMCLSVQSRKGIEEESETMLSIIFSLVD